MASEFGNNLHMDTRFKWHLSQSDLSKEMCNVWKQRAKKLSESQKEVQIVLIKIWFINHKGGFLSLTIKPIVKVRIDNLYMSG